MDLMSIGSNSLTTAASAITDGDPDVAAEAIDTYLAEALRIALSHVRRAVQNAPTSKARAMQQALNKSSVVRAACPDLSRMLPPELWMLVFEELAPQDLANACDASAYFGAVGVRFAADAALWRTGTQRSMSIDLPNRRVPLSTYDRFVRSPYKRDLAFTTGDMSTLRVWRQPDHVDHKVADYVTRMACPPVWSPIDSRVAWVALHHGEHALFMADPLHLEPMRCVTTLPAGSVCSLTWSQHDPAMLAVGIENNVFVVKSSPPVSTRMLIDVCARRSDASPRSTKLLPSTIAWSPSAPRLAIDTASKLHIYDLENPSAPRMTHTLNTKVYSPAHMAWQPGTQRIAVCDHGTLKIWDLKQSEEPFAQQTVYDGFAGCALDSVAWSPHGDLVGVLRQDELCVWQVKPDRLELLRKIRLPHGFVGEGNPRLQWHPRRADTVEITGAHNIWSHELRVHGF